MDIKLEQGYLNCLRKLKNGNQIQIFVDAGGYVSPEPTPFMQTVYVIGRTDFYPNFLLMGSRVYLPNFCPMSSYERERRCVISDAYRVHECTTFLWLQYPNFLIHTKAQQ